MSGALEVEGIGASTRPDQLVLGLGVKITTVVALMQLAKRLTPGARRQAAALRGRALGNLVRPAQDVGAAGPLWSVSTGIFEIEFAATKPLLNWPPSWMRVGHASCSAPLWPSASSSSSITVTLTPLGVASE